MVGSGGHKGRRNMAHTRSMLDKQGYMHARACTHPRSRTHARTRSRTLTQIYCIILISFLRQVSLREGASVLRYTYIVLCVCTA